MGFMFDGVEIPKHIFRAVCQNRECRQTVGAIHMPCANGLVLFACWKCNTISKFENGSDGFDAKVLGRVKQKQG